MKHRLLDIDWQPWWKQLFKVLLGANVAALLKAARQGPKSGWKTCIRSFDTVDPLAGGIGQQEMLDDIREVRLDDLIGASPVSIHIDVQDHQEGTLPWEHAVALVSLAVRERPSTVLEIGTFCGHTTYLLAQNLERSIIHTIDLPADYQANSDVAPLPKDDPHLIANRSVGREYRNKSEAERIVQHWGDTAQWDFSLAQGASFFFIDGSHTYEYARNDSEKCFQLCQGKGVFLWHDCGLLHPGVLRLLSEWRALGRDIVRIRGTTLAYLKTK